MLARSSAPSSSGRCSTLLLAITQRVRVHGAVQKRCITTCAIESNVDAASALLSIPLAQISSSSEVFNNLPLVCTVPGVESDLDLGNTFVALFFALTGLLPISWYIFAWQANKQSSQAGNAGRSALQERTKREEIETELRTAEQRRAAAEAGLKTAAAAFEARVVALTSSNDKAIAALKAKEGQLADLEKQLMVARARSGEVQRRQPSLKPGPTAAAAAIPARLPISKLRAAAALPGLTTTAAAADKLKWDQVEKRRTALQQELQLALTRSRELQQALAQKRVAY